MRIEAAAYRGKPVYFELIGPWTRPERMQPYEPTIGERVGLGILTVLFVSLLLAGAMLARRNVHLGRGDRRGAARLAAFVFAAYAVAVFFGANHVPNFDELALFLEFLAWGLFFSCFIWVLYMALEPYVRRRWPATLVSWSRLLAGDFRDPLVGRDVLAGCLWGACLAVVIRLGWFNSLMARLCSAAAIFGPTVAASGGAHDHCLFVEQLVLFCGPCCAKNGRQRPH
jgi:serine/threonine-protein kinase